MSRTAKEWYHITGRQFDPSGLLHLATDNAQHFYIFAKWVWAGKGTGRATKNHPLLSGLQLLSFNVLKICSQRTGKSRNPGNSITALMIKQASSEKWSPEWSPHTGAGGPAWFCYIQCPLLWRNKSMEQGGSSKNSNISPVNWKWQRSGIFSITSHQQPGLIYHPPLTLCRLEAVP